MSQIRRDIKREEGREGMREGRREGGEREEDTERNWKKIQKDKMKKLETKSGAMETTALFYCCMIGSTM